MSLYKTLFPWQKELVDTYLSEQRFGLFLDMGLGKTIISLAFAEQHECTKVLVVSINAKALEDETVDGSWKYWAKRSSIDYQFKTKYDEQFDNNVAELLTINYESLYERGKNRKENVTIKQNIKSFIESCRGHKVALIIDESHKMKDLQSKQTLAIMKIKQALESVSTKTYLYLLTGTPFTTGYIDLYSQLKALGLEMNKTQFVDRFCERGHLPGLLGWQQPIVGYKNVDELFDIVHQYAITIDSEMVAKNLPDKVFVNHTYEMGLDFEMFAKKKAYKDEILRTFKHHNDIPDKDYFNMPKKRLNNPFYKNIAYPSQDWWATTSGTSWLRARELSIGFQGNAEKSKWFDRRRLDLVEQFLENNPNNYLLFYNYTPEMIELYNICEKLGYNIDVYCGEVKSLFFYDRYEKQSKAERLTNTKNIILANFASGSTGLNWQAYHNCILFSCPIYKDFKQGIKRIHRTGQTDTVIYHTFYQNNFLEHSMQAMLDQRTDYTSDMFEAEMERVNQLMEVNDQ